MQIVIPEKKSRRVVEQRQKGGGGCCGPGSWSGRGPGDCGGVSDQGGAGAAGNQETTKAAMKIKTMKNKQTLHREHRELSKGICGHDKTGRGFRDSLHCCDRTGRGF